MNHYVVCPAGSSWVVSRVEAQPFGGISTSTLSSHPTQAQAQVALAKATGQRAPRMVPLADFKRATSGHSSKPSVYEAAGRICVEGAPWERTCKAYGVSMASVSALLKRHGLR